jgi:nitroimidazol reductase NimA-like FMN-containing flavoprotein (pyridoxamine 5'-phosphate oxidase superfamily)
MADRVLTQLDEEQCLELIASGGIGRIAYVGRFGPAVLPVNYELQDGAIVFRTAEHGALDEDLRTGITGADYHVAFEIDDIDPGARRGWSVLVQGPAHHVTDDERDKGSGARIETWAPGDREMVVRIAVTRITGRRVGPA